MHVLNYEELMRESSLVAGDHIVGIHLCLNVRFWTGSFGILRDERYEPTNNWNICLSQVSYTDRRLDPDESWKLAQRFGRAKSPKDSLCLREREHLV